LLEKIHKNIKIIPSFILVEYYNKEDNIMIINDDENKNNEIVKGIFVQFEISLPEILNKLEKINEIKYKNRLKYDLKLVNVNLHNNKITKAYIII
jgi:hypothetical protein